MQYLTLRLQQKTDGTTFYSLSEFKDSVQDANVLYWNMVSNDIGNSAVTEFTDATLDELGNFGKIRQYSRGEEIPKFYLVKIEKFTEESNKNPIRLVTEYADRDSAEIAFYRDNASAEKDDTILTAAHMVVNHHGGRELYELYDNRPVPEPEPVEVEAGQKSDGEE